MTVTYLPHMQTDVNPNAGLPRRETLDRSHAYLAAILIVLFALGGMAVGSENEQTLSVASTWQLPQEPKAVFFALSPDGESLALSRTNRDVEIWSTSSHKMLREISVEGPTDILDYSPSSQIHHTSCTSTDKQVLIALIDAVCRISD